MTCLQVGNVLSSAAMGLLGREVINKKGTMCYTKDCLLFTDGAFHGATSPSAPWSSQRNGRFSLRPLGYCNPL